MSVIASLETVPNRIRSLVRLVGTSKQVERERIADYLMPGPQRRSDQVSNVLREAVRLGLLSEEGGKISLGHGLRERDVNDDQWFIDYVDRNLFGRELPEADDNRSVAFATSWLLTRSITDALDWNGEYANQIRTELEGEDVYDVTNASRTAMLAYWVRFSGYGEAAVHGNRKTLVPDPTRAIARRLTGVFAKDKSLPIGAFIERLALVAPVLEGGTVRKIVEARMRHPRDSDTLSQSTSLSLIRLQARKLISLSAAADAKVQLLDLGASGKSRVSQITLLDA